MNPTDLPIRIPRHLVNQILHLAQCSGESPMLGLLGTKNGILTTCYPLHHTGGSGDGMAPSERAAVLLAMQRAGETLFATVHSDSGASAPTSESKSLGAGLEGKLQLIVSLDTKGVLEMRAYQTSPGSAQKELELLMTD